MDLAVSSQRQIERLRLADNLLVMDNMPRVNFARFPLLSDKGLNGWTYDSNITRYHGYRIHDVC